MTPEELETLVLSAAKPQQLQSAFSQLTDTERRALSTTANQLKTQIHRSKPNKTASEALQRFLKKGRDTYNKPAYGNATLAVFAMCPISTITKTELFVKWQDRETLEQIILDRKPDWLDEWIEFDVEREFPTVDFNMIRRWYRAGICRKPRANGYIEKFAWEMMSINRRKDQPVKPPLSEQLLAEPDLLDDVWRLFEIETLAFNTESWLKKNAPDNYETWPEALVKLSDNGVLDRQRLLDASLHGLQLDLKQNQLSGFHKFHVNLNPDDQEIQNRQSGYLALLSHNVGHVVKFALAMLTRLEKQGLLDEATFLAEVTAVFMHETKGNIITALKLIKRIISKQRQHSQSALFSIIDALKHQQIDVQEMAADLLIEHASLLEPLHLDELSTGLDFITAATRSRLLGIIDKELAEEQTDLLARHDINDTPELQLETLSTEQIQALGIEQALSCAPGDTYIPPVAEDIMQHRILPCVEALQPVKDVDELISLVSHAVEVVNSPDLVERILDGFSRLCDKRPDDFASRVAPLLSRLRDGGGLATPQGIADAYGGVRLAIADLLFSWLTDSLYHSNDSRYFSDTDALRPYVTLIQDLTQRVIKRQARPLLSAATHQGGWIDPMVWIDRLISCEASGLDYGRMELCLSLLRLTPDNRDLARQRLSELNGRIRAVADFALGGEAQIAYEDRSDYDIWISAARCRAPRADWSEMFKTLQIHDHWPDSVTPAIYHWKAYLQKEKTYSVPRLNIEISSVAQPENHQRSQAITRAEAVIGRITRLVSKEIHTDWERIPSAALNKRNVLKYAWASDINSTWVAQWLENIWPLNPEPAYYLGVKQLMNRIDMDSSSLEPSHGFFQGLFEKRRPWGEGAHLLMSIGLAGKDADCRGLSIDAMVEAIEHGRLDIHILADIFIRLAEGEWLKLNRLAENLQQVARVSTLHAWAVSELIQNWLIKVDVKQHNIFRIFEVLIEAQSIINQPLDDRVRNRLAEISGNSKSARLARQLLALHFSGQPSINELRKHAIHTRISNYLACP